MHLSEPQNIYIAITGYSYGEAQTEIKTECPFCGEQREKFYMASGGMYICFVCGTKGGSILSFIMEYFSYSYKQAKDYLISQGFDGSYESKKILKENNNDVFSTLLGVLVPPNNVIVEKVSPELPTETYKLMDNFDNPKAFKYFSYLKKRGLDFKDLKYYDIRYCDSGEITKPSPLSINSSVIFITRDKKGNALYWNTRTIIKNPYIKSINAPSYEGTYSKSDVVFNQELITHDSSIVWTEGVFNAITVTQEEYVGISTFGKQISNTQISLVTKMKPLRHFIFLDNDAKTNMLSLISKLLKLGIKLDSIYVVSNPFGKQDANDLGKSKSLDLLHSTKHLSEATYIKLIKDWSN